MDRSRYGRENGGEWTDYRLQVCRFYAYIFRCFSGHIQRFIKPVYKNSFLFCFVLQFSQFFTNFSLKWQTYRWSTCFLSCSDFI